MGGGVWVSESRTLGWLRGQGWVRSRGAVGVWAGQNWTCYIHEEWGRGGEGAVDGGGGSGRREVTVGVEGGYKRAMGRLKMAG